jgi:hypothetical protein
MLLKPPPLGDNLASSSSLLAVSIRKRAAIIEDDRPDGRQVLPLRRSASRMLIQPCPHVIGLYTLKLELMVEQNAKNERQATR